jgi:hypothetical protein
VQAHSAEGVVDREREPLGHEALLLVWREGVVPEVATPKRAANDLADVHDTDQRISTSRKTKWPTCPSRVRRRTYVR